MALSDAAYEKLSREELIALLRDMSQQHDNLLSQFEAMAFQVNESTGEIDEAMVEARLSAKRAEDNEHRAEVEFAHANKLSRQLDEERRKRIEIAQEFARFRDTMKHAPVERPWSVMWRAMSQIVSNGVEWVRAKIPPDSPLLPWYDRAVEAIAAAVRLASNGIIAFFKWAMPLVIKLVQWLKSELTRRMNQKL